MNLPVFRLENLFLSGKPFIIGLVVLFLVNVALMRLVFMYGKKKKIPPALVVLLIFVIVDAGFYLYFKNRLSQRLDRFSDVKTVEAALVDPGPPRRDYPFIQKHSIYRNDKFGLIRADDGDTISVALRRGRPRQVFPESFSILFDKEGVRFTGKRPMTEYARFVIIIYYGESEPLFPTSVNGMVNVLKHRKDPEQKKIAKSIEKTLRQNEKKVQEPPVTQGDDWDLEGNTMFFSDPAAEEVIMRIGPPKFTTDWEQGANFRMYSFSLRYNELVEWQFRMFEDGRMDVKKLNVVKLHEK